MRHLVFVALFFAAFCAYGQQRYALVIGNAAYTSIGKLKNPVNDANDMAATLRGLGFQVDLVLDGDLGKMEDAAIRLKNRLSTGGDTYGFFFYAGHGVQSNGENYLIPVDADIRSESLLRQRAMAVSFLMSELNDAGNELNLIVLDACRDNPFSWARSGSRGLQVMGNQPADSIIVYATSAGSTALDGEGRNGLFTSHLLNNLNTPGLEINEVFRMTMGDVARASNNKQRPAIYSQFAGIAYLGAKTPSADEAAWETRQEKGGLVITAYLGNDTAVTIPARIRGVQVIGIEGYYNEEEEIARSVFEGKEVSSVTIPNGITYIGDVAFYETALTSITLPNSVTSIGIGAFSGAHLTSVTLPNSVTSIGDYAFSGCSGLTSITIPTSVTSIGVQAFSGCSGLTSITIPTSVTTIGEWAFWGCWGAYVHHHPYQRYHYRE
jgi:hypothetical protein